MYVYGAQSNQGTNVLYCNKEIKLYIKQYDKYCIVNIDNSYNMINLKIKDINVI